MILKTRVEEPQIHADNKRVRKVKPTRKGRIR